MTKSPFVHTLMATEPLPSPKPVLYERIFAGNGLFVRGQRDHLQVLFPVTSWVLPDVPTLTPAIRLLPPPIPQHLIIKVLAEAHTAWLHPEGPLESLFHLSYGSQWELTIPDQIRTNISVSPRDPEHCPSYGTCLVEIHSHHEMPAFFSGTDDADETGFRIYGVIGNLRQQPHICFRVGLYGQFYPCPANAITSLPAGLVDTYSLNS
jgi:PRTRC genetic system protein A